MNFWFLGAAAVLCIKYAVILRFVIKYKEGL